MALEDRRLLSTFTVDSTADDGSTGTLRWAFTQANATSGANTIDFDASVFDTPQTITLESGMLELSYMSGPLTIDGPSAGVTIDGGGESPVFWLDGATTASMSGLTITGGFRYGVNNNGTVSLDGCTLSGNDGSGLYNRGTAELTDCTISGNSAPVWGGGLANAETMTATDCTIADNTAETAGGLWNRGTTTLINCTITGNSAQDNGGGLYNAPEAPGPVLVYGCTISGDSAQAGGGVYFADGSATLIDTIVAGNAQSGGDISGAGAAGVVGSFNLIGGGGSGGIVGGTDGNIVLTGSTGPGLAPMGHNGGPTETMALLPGSPAIGAGVALKIAPTDQRGDPLDRPPDIGAYQSQLGTGVLAPPVTFVVTSTADDGSVGTLRWAVGQANSVPSASTIDFDLGTTLQTITLTQGQIELSNPSYLVTIDGPGADLLTVSGNHVGRIFQIDPMTAASISGLAITAGNLPLNHASDGGGVLNEGTATLADCTISGNSSYQGGGFYTRGTATLTDCTISGNTASSEFVGGGGIKSGPEATLSLAGCTISDNYAYRNGGGIYAGGPSSTFSDCTISGNSAFLNGGGVYLGYNTTALFTDCTIDGNAAVKGPVARGGGLFVRGIATVIDSSITGNLVDGICNLGSGDAPATLTMTASTISGSQGFGLLNYGNATLTDCTVAGNAAPKYGLGGGISNDDNLDLIGCTISANSASSGAGLEVFPAGTSTTLTDTIVAGNVGGDIEASSGITGTYDLIGTGGSGGLVNGVDGNIVLSSLTNLGLAPLGDYGGPTETMALLPGSAAIGAGTAIAGVTTDQRGDPLDSPPDIGAFQAQPALVVNTTTDGTGSSPDDLSLRQAVNLADVMGAATTITFDPTVFASPQTITLTSGQLELSDTSGMETIIGPAGVLTIDGDGQSRVFQVDGGVTANLSDLTISSGSTGGDGGGVYNEGTITLTECTVSGSSAGSSGGGLYNSRSGVATLTDCTISGNSAANYCGGITNFNTITLTGCTISNNSGSLGGGMSNYGQATLENCTIGSNSAGVGGGLDNVSTLSTATLINCTVSGNFAFANGGGIDIVGGTVTIGDTIVAGNTTNRVGPDVIGVTFISLGHNLIGETDGSSGWIGSDLTGTVAQPLDPLLSPLGNYGGPTQTMALLPGSPALGNGVAADYPGTSAPITADQRGEARGSVVDIGAFQSTLVVESASGAVDTTVAGLTLPGAVVLADEFPGSAITFDPAIFSSPRTITLSATLELSDTVLTTSITSTAEDVTVSGDEAVRVFLVDQGVAVALTGLTISDGSTTGDGGGLYNAGSATLTDCIISGNSAENGGGVCTGPSGTTTLTDCTISGNSAADAGGGLYDDGGTTTLTACTVAGNTAADGGGLAIGPSDSGSDGETITERSTTTIVNCTVSGNTAANGGGLDDPTGTSTVGNTIVAGNTATAGGPDAFGTIGSQGHNLVGETDGSTGWVGSDLTGTVAHPFNPMLGPLGSNGGSTPTMALLAGSPAIDAGSNSIPGLAIPVTDERGALRGAAGLDAGTVVDIGAYEASSSYLVTTAVDSNELGALRAAVGWANLSNNVNPANLADPVANTVIFDTVGTFATPQTITLSSDLGTLELTSTGAAESILGTTAGVTISGGDAVRVFQVDYGASATLSELTITGGSTTGNGGGLYNDGGTVKLDGVTVAGNTATDGGGLFLAEGTSSATDGDVGIVERTTTTIVNCTVSGNTAAAGGGLYVAAAAYLTACTIAANTAEVGGGIDNAALGDAEMEDTIVAGNRDSGGAASDIGGSDAADVTGTYDLAGTGGSGGLAGGTGNVILTGSETPELAPLGNYGGPTPTMPLVPGSPALGTGIAIPGISTDQRGEPLSANVDIGAFQSQGFTLTVFPGSTPQATTAGTAFADPLGVTVAAKNPIEPVAGGVVSFTVDPAADGASAILSSPTVTIGPDGIAEVTATANAIAGSYTVASEIGGANPATFDLTNLIALTFSGIVDQDIPLGTQNATFSGTLANGTQAPAEEDVAITLAGVTQQATVDSSGHFSTTFDTSSFTISTTPYTVSYAYTSDGVFGDAGATSSLTITQITPSINWTDPAAITYGTALSATQLDATASVVGTLTYNLGPGTVLHAGGGQNLSVTFVPADQADYMTTSASVTIDVDRAAPVIAWSDPAEILYGTALSSSQLDAAASWTVAGVEQTVAGTFTYTPAPGAILKAGSDQTLSVTFTPSDSTDYGVVSSAVTIDVGQATPALSWPVPADITYGTPLSSTQLDATTSWTVAGVEQSVAGTFTYTPAAGTVLKAGDDQTLSVTFTPADTTDYSTSSAFVTMDVDKAAPVISWPDPAGTTYGTPLSASQLDATASVPGTFAYSPAQGTVLNVGTGQTLSVTFTPSDSAEYTVASASVAIDVDRAMPSLTVSAPGGTFDGNAFPASVTIAGSGTDDTPAASLEDVAPTLTYFDGPGTSGTGLGSTPPTAAGTYTVVASFPGSDDYAPTQSAPATFTIAPAAPTITLRTSGGSAVYGQSVTLAVTITTAGDSPGGSITFLDGTTPMATVPLDGDGQATLTISALAVGPHSIVATYSGDADDLGGRSGPVSVTVSPAAAEIVLTPQAVVKKKRVVSLGLRAIIRPLAPGAGVPTGEITFEVRSKVKKKVTEKVLGTAILNGGTATLSVKPATVARQPITVIYGGDAEFAPSQSTTTVTE